MIDFGKFQLNNEDILWYERMKDACINGQNELSLQYGDFRFCLEPSGETVSITDAHGTVAEYPSFDDLFLQHQIDGKPLISLFRELDFCE